MKLVVTVYTHGQIQNVTKANGRIIKCMARGNFGGQMVKSIQGSLKKIKEMDRESLDGKMAENMKESGSLESSMV